jgi:chromate transporter
MARICNDAWRTKARFHVNGLAERSTSPQRMQPEARASHSIPFGEAWRFWLKLGFISFGGPAGQIAIMHRELVERRGWISEQRFLHALNYCMLLPGPEAQQLATYIGWLMHRSIGGLLAGGLFVLPSLVILILLSWLYLAFGHTALISGVFYGIKPAVTAIVLFAAYRIGSRALRNAWLWAIAAAAFVAIFALNIAFPWIVGAATLIGYIGGKFAPALFQLGQTHGPAQKKRTPAIIDDDTPAPAHAQFAWRKAVVLMAGGLLLWAGALGALSAAFGWQATLTQMGWFFTKAALLTFGGAYAVLPYVYQGAVDHYQWLTPLQMIDGLALGETTPGPLIMVVAFVGFVGAWQQTIIGGAASVWAGVLGASVATFFTFLPSFLFIFIGAPAVEATRGDLRFTAPLTGITAAIVGVIVNLACFFAYHVFWPHGFTGALDWLAIAIAVVAAIALLRFKVGVIPVILVSGVLGALVGLARG